MNKLVICYLRRLSVEEKNDIYRKTRNRYKWVTEGEATWLHGNTEIKVPKGFLADGSTGGPDFSIAWLFHDYLYRTHKIGDRPCTRQEADNIMIDILKYQRHYAYAWVAKTIFRVNPFWVVSSAWNYSGRHGPHFL